MATSTQLPPSSPSNLIPPGKAAWSHLGSPAVAIAILAAFWLVIVAGTRDQSLTFDESGNAAGGFTYWKFNDYRFNPENGNLPQRVFGLPLVCRRDRFPATDSEEWRTAEKEGWARRWFYQLGNDAEAMALFGRAASALFAVGLGAVVWLWARKLFGPLGGLLALLLCVLNPAILANGALMTADTAGALLFLASTWSLWALLQRLTVWRVLLTVLTVGGLCVTNASAVLMVPVALTLVVARLLANRPLPMVIGVQRVLTRRRDQAWAFATIGILHLVLVPAVIWACYGFRYAAFAPSLPGGGWQTDSWEFVLFQPGPDRVINQLRLDPSRQEQARQALARADADPDRWTSATRAAVRNLRATLLKPDEQRRLDALLAEPPPALMPQIIDFLRRHELLPEAWLYGYAQVWRHARAQASFLNGRISLPVSPWLLLYAFLVKTPLVLPGIIALALAALARRPDPFYEATPLGALLVLYGTATLIGHFDTGYRHLLTVYPPLFVLCGAAAGWLDGSLRPAFPRFVRVAGGALGLLLAACAVETVCWFPHYLAYFNGLIRPDRAYRHLVDSSLDWGQDLPGVKRFLAQHPAAGPAYLSYYGTASPAYYRIPVLPLYSHPNRDQIPPLQILTVPAGTDISDLLRRHPDYDPDVVGLATEGGTVHVTLVRKAAGWRLAGGTYFISATMLQPVMDWQGAWGPWNQRYEAEYQAVAGLVQPLLNDDPKVRRAAMRRLPPEQWLTALSDFQELRFRRLTAFLRQREPDNTINYSILVYRLTDADLTHALHGPPPELGPDLPMLLSAGK
jgi:hypothetical protein